MKSPAWVARLKRRADRLKREIWALFLAWKDPGTQAVAVLFVLVWLALIAWLVTRFA